MSPRNNYRVPADGGGGNTVNSALPSPTAMIYRSEFDYLSRCILDYPNIETGGQLFGFWTAEGIPVVLYAIGPGPRANHQHAFFNQDIDYLSTVGQSIIDIYGLQHIGEWHSHHRLGLAHPSGHDANTMIGSIRRLNLHQFLLCIGNIRNGRSTINPFNFHESDLYNYRNASWTIIEGDSPYRAIVDRRLNKILVHPYTAHAGHGSERISQAAVKMVNPTYKKDYWLTEKANNLELKKIIDFIMGELKLQPSPKLDDKGHVHLFATTASGEKMSIYFPELFPLQAPDITLPRSLCAPVPPLPDGDDGSRANIYELWGDQGSISERFIACFRQMQGLMPPPLPPQAINIGGQEQENNEIFPDGEGEKTESSVLPSENPENTQIQES